MSQNTTRQAAQVQDQAGGMAAQNRRFVVQQAPDGKRFEVVERETLNLGGIYWDAAKAQGRADYLEGLEKPA